MIDRQEKLKIAWRQGVVVGTIYNRQYQGWTDDEIRAGATVKSDNKSGYIPKFGGCYTNGADLFMVLLFEIVKSIARLPNEMDNYFLTCLVYRGLLNRGV